MDAIPLRAKILPDYRIDRLDLTVDEVAAGERGWCVLDETAGPVAVTALPGLLWKQGVDPPLQPLLRGRRAAGQCERASRDHRREGSGAHLLMVARICGAASGWRAASRRSAVDLR